MDKLGPTEATNVTSRILKGQSQREGQNKALGSPVHPSKFPAYVFSVCRAEKDWNANLERFTVNEAVRRNLNAAFKRAPKGKAVGPDGVSVEMLAANADIGLWGVETHRLAGPMPQKLEGRGKTREFI